MKDYQRAWYIQLLLMSTRSERLGYLSLDESLWRIAGAHSRPMWEAHKGEVLACFKIREYDGKDWIYNERLLSVMEEQSGKYYRKKTDGTSSSPVVSDFDSGSKSSNGVCPVHGDVGRTPKGGCWGCYSAPYQDH